MRTVFLFTCFFVALNIHAQTDSSFKSSLAPAYRNVQTLTRTDIERLPAYSFLELVQGAFPFISDKSVIEEDYSFVVNGFFMINPNTINISQIESISFFPSATDLTRGSQTKKGTFVITTRSEKNGFAFSTETGIVLPNKNSTSPYSIAESSSNGFNSLDEVSYHHKTKAWFTSNSFSFLKSKAPDYTIANSVPRIDSSVSKSSSEMRRFRFSNFAGYEFSNQIKLEAGLFFTNQPATANTKTNHTGGSFFGVQTYTGDQKVRMISGHAGLTILPSSNISNQLTIEIVKSKEDGGSLLSQPYFFYPNSPPGTYYNTTNFTDKYTTYAFSNNFVWNPLHSSSSNLVFGLFIQEQFNKMQVTSNSKWGMAGNPAMTSTSFSESSTASESFNVNPVAHFSFKQLLFAQAGFSYDNYHESISVNQQKKILPNAGLRLELASLLKSRFISSLEFSGNYNKYISVKNRIDLLETDNQATIFFSGNTYGAPPYLMMPGNNDSYIENWLASVSVGIYNNRFVVKSQYRNFNEMVLWYLQVYNSGYVSIYDRLTTKGLCFELKASVIEKQKLSWKLYATACEDKRTLNSSGYRPQGVSEAFSDAGKTPWRGGARTSANCNRFFLQASTLFNLNEAAFDKNGNFQDDLDGYNANFLIVGYKLPIKKAAIKDVEISAQSRNLFHSKSYMMDKYVGIGAQLNF